MNENKKSFVANTLLSALLLYCIMCIPLLAQEVSLTEEERAWLKEHPDIELGFTDGFEPEVIVNPDGTYSGMAAEDRKPAGYFLDE